MSSSGNNYLGGQDFSLRLFKHLLSVIEQQHDVRVDDAEDLQALRDAAEQAKLRLTYSQSTIISVTLTSIKSKNTKFEYVITREKFEALNSDLFKKVLEPLDKVLEFTEFSPADIDEIVLVGGSTRIPKVRQLIEEYFGKVPNTAIDPELAVVSGVSIQAGILGGAWPLQVSAIEVETSVQKIHVHWS